VFFIAQAGQPAKLSSVSVHRKRALLLALASLALIWLVAFGGYTLARKSKVTPEKVATYLNSVDLSKLSGDARAKAINDLARQMNALSIDERRRARWEGAWQKWFDAMTEEEKSSFVEATLPSGFKQMIASFEELPDDRRKRALEAALNDLKRANDSMLAEGRGSFVPRGDGDENAPPISPDLQQKIISVGLKTFYQESSAATKAEVAPLLEELQRLMESGRLFRRGHYH
jgi:hypothetical protein